VCRRSLASSITDTSTRLLEGAEAVITPGRRIHAEARRATGSHARHCETWPAPAEHELGVRVDHLAGLRRSNRHRDRRAARLTGHSHAKRLLEITFRQAESVRHPVRL
jgi:hypothetical protein